MTKSEEIQDLKEVINNILAHQAILTTRVQLLESLLLTAVSQIEPTNFKSIFTNHVNNLEEQTLSSLRELEPHYLKTGDCSFALRKSVEFQLMMNQLKSDEHYEK